MYAGWLSQSCLLVARSTVEIYFKLRLHVRWLVESVMFVGTFHSIEIYLKLRLHIRWLVESVMLVGTFRSRNLF